MIYQPSQCHIFVIHNGSSAIDPEELVAVTEIDRQGNIIAQMSDFTVVKELIYSIEERRSSNGS
jgi:hypothetical protein